MVFDTASPPASLSSTDRACTLDCMFKSSTNKLPLSDERDLSQIEAANKQQPSKWKMMSKRRQSCSNDMYASASRYHRLKPATTMNNFTTVDETQPITSFFSSYEKYFTPQSSLITTRRSTTDCNDLTNVPRRPLEQTNNTLLTIVDEESTDSIWPPSDDQLLLKSGRSSNMSNRHLPLYYSDSSITPCLTMSSFNSNSNSSDLNESSLSYYNDLSATSKSDHVSSSSLSSSSGYESNIPTTDSSLNSVSNNLFISSPDSLIMPPPPVPIMKLTPNSDRNLVEQFIDLHLQKQISFENDVAYSPPSSFSSTSSSFLSQTPISTTNSPVLCRKCVKHEHNNQLSSDTEDDSQSTTISTNILPVQTETQQQEQQKQEQQQQQQQQQQNKRPRSLPIAIQHPKGVSIPHDNQYEYDDDNDDADCDYGDNSSKSSFSCHCSMVSSRKKRLRTCEFNQQPLLNVATSANALFSESDIIKTKADKLIIDLNEIDNETKVDHTPIKQQKNSLEHFIMSPTDKVKIQMKYPSINNSNESDHTRNEIKISQPEDIDFKRSKQKAIRILYQNRLNLNSIQSPVSRQNTNILPLRTAIGHCDSPLAKRTVNPRLLRSVLSCSVIEADDEHEVVSSTAIANPPGVSGTREKSHIETFNCLRSNFMESLLHGKILPCGILDGFTVKLGASGLFMPKQVVLPVTTFWFNVSEHQAASPYLGFINLQCLPKRGYHTPTKGTITLALLNPNGTAVHLFIILYDLSDMPPDHRTFIRQRIVLMPETTGDNKLDKQSSKGSLRYLAHIRFVTSQTGKLYMHSDIRLIFARNKLDYDDRTAGGKTQLVTLTDTPTPKYWSRK